MADDLKITLVYKGGGSFQVASPIEAEYCERKFKVDDRHIFKATRWSKEKGRTLIQNNALHLWFSKIADACFAAGIEITKLMPKKLAHPVTAENFKADVFKPCCNALYEHNQSSKLEKEQLSRLVMEIDNRILLPQGIDVKFPSYWNQGE